jgi:MFS family permease
MRPVLDLLRQEGRARIFFLALAQSSIGTGAAYVALLLIAYERFRSPWAIGLILLADVLPAMLLGPIFGAVADRFSRRGAMIVADVIRVVAFAGIALVDGFVATLLLALLAGVGTGMFTPSALAALPSVVQQGRLPAASALYGAVMDLGFVTGPGLGALVLLLGGPEMILAFNAVTFAMSALLLLAVRFGRAPPLPESGEEQQGLLRSAREGLVITAGIAGLRIVLLASGVALFFGGFFNVGEVLLATEELDVGDSGYSILVTAYGIGFIVGSLAGGRGGTLRELKWRYLAGMVLMACGFAASGVAPTIGFALFTFMVGGFGNGLMLVYERLLIQALVPDALSGRVFGVKDALTAWAWALAFLAGAGALSIVGTRTMVAVAGAGVLITWVASWLALRGTWRETVRGEPDPSADGRRADLTAKRGAGEYGTDVVGGSRGERLAALDDAG